MALHSSGDRRVVAVYPNLETARRAVTALEGKGIDGTAIELLGEGPARADASGDVSGRDRAVVSTVGKGSAAGLLAGGVVGTAAGLLVAVVVGGALPGTFVVVGALMGALFGSAVGGWSRLRATEDWDLTFEPSAVGEVIVAVASVDSSTLDTAADALRESGASNVELH